MCGSLPQAVLDGQSEVRAVSLRCGVSVLLQTYVSPSFLPGRLCLLLAEKQHSRTRIFIVKAALRKPIKKRVLVKFLEMVGNGELARAF